MDTATQPESDTYVSVPRAATLLGMGPKALHELLDAGRIPFIQPLKQRRVKVSDVRRYRDSTGRGRKSWIEQVPGDDPLAD